MESTEDKSLTQAQFESNFLLGGCRWFCIISSGGVRKLWNIQEISLIYELWFISKLPIDILFNSETIPNVFISLAISLIKDLIYVPSLTLTLISAFSLSKLRISISLTLIFLFGISTSVPSLAYL